MHNHCYFCYSIVAIHFQIFETGKTDFLVFSYLLKIKSGVIADPLIICIDGFLRNFFTWKNALFSL